MLGSKQQASHKICHYTQHLKHLAIMACDFVSTRHTENQVDVMEVLSTLKLCLHYQSFQYRI